MNKQTTEALYNVLETGLRNPHSYTPDLAEEARQMPQTGATPFIHFTVDQLTRDEEIAGLYTLTESDEVKAEPHSLVSNDGTMNDAGVDREVTHSEDAFSEKSLARSAGSLHKMTQEKGERVGSLVADWMERYPNLGVPDVDDDLGGVVESNISLEDLPSDSGYGSGSKIAVPRVELGRSQSPSVEKRCSSSLAAPVHADGAGINRALTPCSDIVGEELTPASTEVTHSDESIANPLDLEEFEAGWCDRGFHVDFSRNEREPLYQIRFLGQGVNGPVYETKCKGISLAWKRKFKRRGIGPRERKEMSIMKKLSHRHITKLIGSYTAGKFFGLLVWPVAVCDLATLLEDMDTLKQHIRSDPASELQDSEVMDRFEALGLPSANFSELHSGISRRLMRSFGCITNAVAYFHDQGIKHKDLKPSNVLLSRAGGLWITDFECSTDFTFLTSSVTEEGERGTAKYFAPEVADRAPASRAADIFTLGCIFLEMMWMCDERNTLDSLHALRPEEDSLFHNSFQNNLKYRDKWIEGLPTPTGLHRHLAAEIRQMLDPISAARPKASELQTFFLAFERLNVSSMEPLLHNPCCLPKPPPSPSPPPTTAKSAPPNDKDARPTLPHSQANETSHSFPHAFERWEMLSSHWEGLTSYWIRRLETNNNELANEPLVQQMSRQITDLSAAGANLFHAIVELQRLRASSERKFQRWFYEHRLAQEEAAEQRGALERALEMERRKRKVVEGNLRVMEHTVRIGGKSTVSKQEVEDPKKNEQKSDEPASLSGDTKSELDIQIPEE